MQIEGARNAESCLLRNCFCDILCWLLPCLTETVISTLYYCFSSLMGVARIGLSWSMVCRLGAFPLLFSDLPPASADSWARVSSIVASRRLLADEEEEEEEGEERMREETEEGGRVCSVVRLRSSWRDLCAQGSNWVLGEEEGEASGML